jgi:hypothetical protein
MAMFHLRGPINWTGVQPSGCRWSTYVGIACATFLNGGFTPVRAQTTDSLVVRVVNAHGAPIGGADVVVRRVAGALVAHATADAKGFSRLSVTRDTFPVELLVRHFGFEPSLREIALPDSGPILRIVLLDAPRLLDTLAVRSSQTAKERSYHLNASDIEHSTRRVADGWDVLRVLRPDIAYGREPNPKYSPCQPPGVQNVWINGVWIAPEFVPVNEMVLAREPRSSSVTPHLNSTARTYNRAAVMSAIASIKPEDIEEMTFRDCLDKPTAPNHSTDALFIVLKPGVRFDPGKGSLTKPPK